MVSGSPDATIAIFDLSSKNEKALKTVKQHEYKIFSVAVNKEEKLMVSSASGSEIIFWDFNKMKVLKREKANAWIVYNSKFIEGTNYIATGQSNGQLRLYGTFSFSVVGETPALKTWSRATGFNWVHPSLKNVMY